jgi:hypothetical protein
MRKVAFTFIWSLLFGSVQCQPELEHYKLSTESIKKKNTQLTGERQLSRIRIIGKYKNKIALVGIDSSERRHFFLYDESSNLVTPYSFKVNQTKNIIVRVRIQDDIALVTGYLDIEPEFQDFSISNLPIKSHEYQHVWIQSGDKEYKIDSLPYHFIDKYYELKFSDNSRYLICNPFTSLTPSYSSNEDGVILLYDLKDVTRKGVKKKIVQCERCLNAFIFGEYVYFQKERPIGNGFDGDYHNIYKAPLSNMSDTTLLAFNIELVLISPDRRYILGGQYLYGKYCLVIIDLMQGRFQYILGRDYLRDRCFYSTHEGKFAFDFDDYTVYIETPKDFPFDALVNNSRFTSQNENLLFWKKFRHEALNKR